MTSKKDEQLCWSCANACCGCSWSRWYEPVDGWTAEKTVIVQAGYRTESYKVTACPEYESDRRTYKQFPRYDMNELDEMLVKGSEPINKGIKRRMVEAIPEYQLRIYMKDLKPNEQNVVMICIIKQLTVIDAAKILYYSVSRVNCILSEAINKILQMSKVSNKSVHSAIGE